jgi:hypothetical protein
MNLRTPICDLFDIEVPIFLAGMGGVAYAEVCAAVSEAGGFGTLGMAGVPPEGICWRRYPTRCSPPSTSSSTREPVPSSPASAFPNPWWSGVTRRM